MKFFISIILLCIMNASIAQASKIEKLERSLKTASTLNDFKNMIDGDVASAICSLLGGGAVCDVLSVTPLNETEKEELEEIKSKWALDQFLIEKGFEPKEFYMKLWQHKNSQTITSRLEFLKSNSKRKFD